MNKVGVVLFALLALFSCIEKQSKNTEKLKIKPNIENDTIVIKEKTAIMYEPTDKAIEKWKKEVGEEDFYIGADDYLFYLNESYKYLESKHLKILKTKNNKTLEFVSANETKTIIQLNNESEIWGIYFFDPKQKPKGMNWKWIRIIF